MSRGALSALFFALIAWLFVDVVAAIGGHLILAGAAEDGGWERASRIDVALGLARHVAGLVVAALAVATFRKTSAEASGASTAGLILSAIAALLCAGMIAVGVLDLAGDPAKPWLHVETRALLGHATRASWVAVLATSVLVFAAVGRAHHAQVSMGLGIAAIVLAAWWAAAPIAVLGNRPPTWGWVLVLSLLRVVWGALWLLVIAQARRAVAADDDATAAANWAPGPEWDGAARGLGLYSGGIKIGLLVVVVGAAGALTGALMKSVPIVVAAMVLLPVGLLASQVLMLIGLAGWARVPSSSGARVAGLAGLILQALGLLVSVGGAFLSARVALGGHGREEQAFATAGLLQTASYVLTLVALLCLLASFARAARHIGASDLARRVTPVAILLIMIVVGSALQRFIAMSPVAGGGGLIIIGFAILFLALMGVLMYVGVIDRLRWAIHDGPQHRDMSDPDFV